MKQLLFNSVPKVVTQVKNLKNAITTSKSTQKPSQLPAICLPMKGTKKPTRACSADFEGAFAGHACFFSVPFVAKALGVSKQHVYNLIETGEIDLGTDIRVAGSRRSCIRIPRSSLLRFLNARHALRAEEIQPSCRSV